MRTVQTFENLQFDGIDLSRACKFSAKKVSKSYHSWHWRVIQDLKENSLFFKKMTWEIWCILRQAVESLKSLFNSSNGKHIISTGLFRPFSAKFVRTLSSQNTSGQLILLSQCFYSLFTPTQGWLNLHAHWFSLFRWW